MADVALTSAENNQVEDPLDKTMPASILHSRRQQQEADGFVVCSCKSRLDHVWKHHNETPFKK
jgi:hypothetical protein